MSTYIQYWLAAKLGIVIDLTAENFGKHTKDGRLLAKLLYFYGILPQHVLNSIKPSRNVNDCYNNLKILKPFLEFMEVPVKNEILYEMASGYSTASLHIFYALYLHFSEMDRLHYLSAQKERKFNKDKARREMTIVRVPEKDLKEKVLPCESKYAYPLIDKQFMIARHKEKCKEILQKIRCTREKFSKLMEPKETELKPIISRHSTSKKLTKKSSEIEYTKTDIKSFDEKHNVCERELNYYELIELQNQVKSTPMKSIPDFEEAKGFINSIKLRSKKEMITNNFQEQLQSLFVDEIRNNLKNKQDDEFEELVTKNLLRQSQYEKQMCQKMAFIKRQKELMLQNRQIVGNISMREIAQKEYFQQANDLMTLKAEENYDTEFERQRQLELHKRMYGKKVQLKFKERLEEAKSIIEKLIDIAIRISEFRELFYCEMPRHLMKDMKELFFKNLSIFDILDDIAEIYKRPVHGDLSRISEKDFNIFNDEEENEFDDDGSSINLTRMDCEESVDQNPDITAEFIRQEVLNECDVDDYLHLLGPWTVEGLLKDKSNHEENQSVLGYIVHKLLSCKYPTAAVTKPVHLKPMFPRAVVQGSNDSVLLEMLTDIMTLKRILVVRIEDAINFVLRAYKAQEPPVEDLDVTFQQATKAALRGKIGTDRMKDSSKKRALLKKDESNRSLTDASELSTMEVATQTPRNIPEDDPMLTPNADIGKSAFEALGVGDPVPDKTIVSAVIAYVSSLQDDYDGWVLWNYPVVYSQVGKLEAALTGYQLLSTDDEIDSMEDTEEFGSRSDFRNPNNENVYSGKRLSRLVPKPEEITSPTNAESYFTSFIKLQKNNGEDLTINENNQTQGEEWIKKFYMDHNIFHMFEFTKANFQLIKNIGKVILSKTSESVENIIPLRSRASVEIFGDHLKELNEKYNAPKKSLDSDMNTSNKGKSLSGNISETSYQSKDEKMNNEIKEDKNENDSKIPNPGDPDWEWEIGEQDEELQLTLANFWENLETVFIEDLKLLFFCLRIHRENTIKYKSFLKKSSSIYLKREDSKQMILNEFQYKFNEIDDDLRADCEIKCELHVRVSELEEILLETADDRKQKSNHYRMQFVNDNWLNQEISNLVNLYIKIMQLEADRCIDTCQFINDYYISLLQKPINENHLQKIYAPTIYVNQKNYSNLSAHLKFSTSNNPSSARTSFGKMGKTFSTTGKSKSSKGITDDLQLMVYNHQPEVAVLSNGNEAIHEILSNLTYSENTGTPYHKFFIGTLENLKNGIVDIIENCITEAKRISNEGRAGGVVGGGGMKDKTKLSDVKIEGKNHLNAEWTAALEAELNRFLFRVKLIQSRGISEFDDFIWSILNVLISIYEEIGETYNKEILSISECCKVFRCAIEEEVPVQPRLELKVYEFIINEDSLLFPNELEESFEPKTFKQLQHFTIEQLSFMLTKLQFIAPNGEIIRRSFLNILQDLRVMKSEDGKPRLLPLIWDELNPNDLPLLFDQIYQRIEVVNWKDFIIYALALPIPTDLEILSMRTNFRVHDPSSTELITRKDFFEVAFWFEESIIRYNYSEVKEFLFRMYQVDENYTNYTALLLAFCKDKDPFVGFIKAISLSSGKRIIIDESDLNDDIYEENDNIEIQEEEEEWTEESGSVNSVKCKKYNRQPCPCQDLTDYQSIDKREEEEEGESYGLHFNVSNVKELYTSNIPKDVIKRVLMASYPFFSQLSILLRCEENFEVTINKMINDLVVDNTMIVNASKLVKHKFIRQLMITTNKFKMIYIEEIVKSMTNEKSENPKNCT